MKIYSIFKEKYYLPPLKKNPKNNQGQTMSILQYLSETLEKQSFEFADWPLDATIVPLKVLSYSVWLTIPKRRVQIAIFCRKQAIRFEIINAFQCV